jgi:hypothetical protein
MSETESYISGNSCTRLPVRKNEVKWRYPSAHIMPEALHDKRFVTSFIAHDAGGFFWDISPTSRGWSRRRDDLISPAGNWDYSYWSSDPGGLSEDVRRRDGGFPDYAGALTRRIAHEARGVSEQIPASPEIESPRWCIDFRSRYIRQRSCRGLKPQSGHLPLSTRHVYRSPRKRHNSYRVPA